MQRLWFSCYWNTMSTYIFDLKIFPLKKVWIIGASLCIESLLNVYKFSPLLISLLRKVLLFIIPEEEDRHL